MSLKDYINKNKSKLEFVYGKLDDVEYLYLQNAINIELWQRDILPKIKTTDISKISPGLIQEIKIKKDEMYNKLINTGAILISKNNSEYVLFSNMLPKRMPQDSLSDPSNLTGSRDGFNELIADNRNLIKKRLKTDKLIFLEYLMGTDSLTEINIVFLNNLIDFKILSNIKKLLSTNIKNNIISINDLTKLISPSKLVPIVESTGSPETCANALLAGRLVILIDNNPTCLILPSSLFQFTENVNEVNNYHYSTIFNRIFILIFLFISIFSLGLFVVLSSHHPESLSTVFIANFQLTERGTTFPLITELIIVLILFEFYRQMTSRSPLSFVQNIIIIFGGLFIGQNAIEASLIGSVAIIIASLSFVSSFAITNNQLLITSFSIFRIFILVMSFILGIIGFLVSTIIVIDYLININIFNQSYLYPFFPLKLKKIKEWFIPRKS